MNQILFALPTEPLLEQAGAGLRERAVDAEAAAWLQRVADAPDAESRGAQLFSGIRDALPGENFVRLLRSLLGSAARGEDVGILGLATLVHVQAPGETVLESVREFVHLHRMVERLHLRQRRGEEFSDAGKSLLADLERLDDELSGGYGLPTIQPGALPHPRDIGPAAIARRAFARIEGDLRERGSLSDVAMDHFLKLCDLELRALALRAATIAERLNPESARQLAEVVPMLNALDATGRELREFLVTLAQERRASLFFEQTHAIRHHLVREDGDRLLLRCAEHEELHVLRRIFAALERRPLQSRLLGYFVERLYAIGDALVAQRARRHPIELVEALLIACEFADGAQLRLPAGERVRAALAKQALEGVEVAGSELVVRSLPHLQRRLALPLGLPRYQSPDLLAGLDARASIKDLILDNINNTSVLLGFLKNQKIVSTPGVVALIVQRSRAMNVLDTICETRNLHSGFANKDVPLQLLKCSMRIPIKTLRRFINVRYVNKVDLRRLAVDRSSVRREISEEVERYLKSLN